MFLLALLASDYMHVSAGVRVAVLTDYDFCCRGERVGGSCGLRGYGVWVR